MSKSQWQNDKYLGIFNKFCYCSGATFYCSAAQLWEYVVVSIGICYLLLYINGDKNYI